jgi:hypothetical protein
MIERGYIHTVIRSVAIVNKTGVSAEASDKCKILQISVKSENREMRKEGRSLVSGLFRPFLSSMRNSGSLKRVVIIRDGRMFGSAWTYLI